MSEINGKTSEFFQKNVGAFSENVGDFLKNVGVFLNVIGKPLEDVEHNCWSAAAKTELVSRARV